jgi:glutathione-independent formaldehyde dehydrogenase
MAAHSAALRGAAQVFVVDKEPDRLVLAERYGAGVDCGVEAVGYQAHDQAGQEHPAMVLDKLIEVVRATGRIGVVGVYNPEDPGAATEDARQGRYGFVSHELPLDRAPDAYARFDQREDGWTKVLLKPG